MSHFKVAAAALLAVSIAGCHLPLIKIDREGYYTFKLHPIRVKAPEMFDLAVMDKESREESWVDFTSGRFWTIQGRYTVHVFPLPEGVSDETSFFDYAEPFLGQYLVEDPAVLRLKHMKVKHAGRTTVRGRTAYEALGIDEIGWNGHQAALMAIAILFDSRLVIASYLTPISVSGAGGASFEEVLRFETRQYRTSFIQSIEEIKQ